jgi:glyoxylase-like metal-dependent hydrolase (beta-lactamase superfamily II)
MQPIALGGLKIRKFVEGAGNIPVPAAMFQGVSPEALQGQVRALDPRARGSDADTLLMSMHSFVLQTDGRVILIDTCNGNDKRRSGPLAAMNMLKTDYLDQLGKLGLKPEDIDTVLCTHLHADHVGWNTRLENGEWVATFPNARYLMSRLDVEYCESMSPDHHRYGLVHDAYVDSVLPVLRSGQAELVETGHLVEHGIGTRVWLEGAPGHTPGTMLIHAEDSDGRAIFSGDVFHHPIQIQDPAIHIGVDSDMEAAFNERRRLADRCASSGAILLAAHFPAPTAGRVQQDGKGLRFQYLD